MGYIDLNWAQKEAQGNIAQILSAGVQRSYVDMPTGTGKTGIMLNTLDVLNGVGALPDTVIMAPTKLIADNNFKELEKFAPSLHGTNRAARLTIGDLKDHSARAIPVKFMTYASGIEALRLGLIKSLLIMPDEGQHSLSQMRQEVLGNLPHKNFQIAFTASPEFSREKSLSAAGYEEAYYLGLREAVEGHILSDIRNIMIEMDEFEGVLDSVSLTAGDYNPHQIEKIVNDSRVLDAAIKFYREGRNKETGQEVLGSSGLVSCNSIAHSIAYAERFNRAFPEGSLGKDVIGCAAIWGDMPDAQKNELLEMHKEGQIKQLACKDYLIEGYDNPLINHVLNLRPTCSGVVAEQRGGRAIRYDHSSPWKEAWVVDFVFPSKRNQQLLYGDVIGGFVFEKSGNPQKCKSNGHEDDEMSVEGLNIAYSEKQIFSFLKHRDDTAAISRAIRMNVANATMAKALYREGLTSQDAIIDAVKKFLYDNALEHDPRYQAAASRTSVLRLLRGEISPFKQIYTAEFGSRPKDVARYNHTAQLIAGVLKVSPMKLFGRFSKDALPNLIEDFGGPDPEHLFYDGHDYDIDGLEERSKDMATPEEIEEARQLDLELNSADPNATPDDFLDEVRIKRQVSYALSTLSPRYEFVIRSREGINMPEQTCREIGDRIDLSGGRVNQMELKAMRLLRHPFRKNILEGCEAPERTTGKYLFDTMKSSIELYNVFSEMRSQGKRYVALSDLSPEHQQMAMQFNTNRGVIYLSGPLVNSFKNKACDYAQQLGHKVPGIWKPPGASFYT